MWGNDKWNFCLIGELSQGLLTYSYICVVHAISTVACQLIFLVPHITWISIVVLRNRGITSEWWHATVCRMYTDFQQFKSRELTDYTLQTRKVHWKFPINRSLNTIKWPPIVVSIKKFWKPINQINGNIKCFLQSRKNLG